MTRTLFVGALITCCVLLLGNSDVGAVTSRVWTVKTRADFQQGQPESVSIEKRGAILLAPEVTSKTGTEDMSVWQAVEGPDGTLYLGSGNDGKVYALDRKRNLSVLADLEELEVFALAVDATGDLYVGASPGGNIYRIDKSKQVSTFFSTGDEYIWSLVFDDNGNLFAATGDQGKLYKISPEGHGEIFYDSRETHIRSLARNDQYLYAGSEENGIIYRFGFDGNVFVLFDSALAEISALAVDEEGNLYAAAIPPGIFRRPPVPKVPPKKPEKKADISSTVTVGARQPTGEAAKPPTAPPLIPAKKGSEVYKIAPSGSVSRFWRSSDALVYSMTVSGDELLIGTGDEGKVYSVDPNGEESLLYKVSDKQVLFLGKTATGKLLLGTGNNGSLVVLGDGFASNGNFISDAFDTGATSSWGKISWRQEVPRATSVTFASRTGNTEDPDDTWSDWSEEYSNPGGSDITSPPARFLQWRATLEASSSSKTPKVTEASVAYLQENLPPTVVSIAISQQGRPSRKGSLAAKSQQGRTGLTHGGGKEQGKGEQPVAITPGPAPGPRRQVSWAASDPNNDSLINDLYFKGIEETNWKLLKDELTAATYQWDTEAVPDGEYLVKVVASDRPSNPKAEALSGERVSDSFKIDNTSPQVVKLRSTQHDGTATIDASIIDDLSTIQEAEYSIDADEWVMVLPEDGIFDSPKEKVAFEIEDLSAGEHTVVVKAVDSAGNVGSGKTVFVVR